MAGLNGSLNIAAAFNFAGVPVGASPLIENISMSKQLQFAAGNGALGLADVCYHKSLTLAPSANQDLDLKGLLTDAFGNVVNNAEVCLILLIAAAANTNNVIMKPGAANGFLGPFGAAAHQVSVEPGDAAVLMSTKGWAVTAGTGDLLNVANSAGGTSVTFELLIVGRSIVG